jgi:hypothetical protein
VLPSCSSNLALSTHNNQLYINDILVLFFCSG